MLESQSFVSHSHVSFAPCSVPSVPFRPPHISRRTLENIPSLICSLFARLFHSRLSGTLLVIGFIYMGIVIPKDLRFYSPSMCRYTCPRLPLRILWQSVNAFSRYNVFRFDDTFISRAIHSHPTCIVNNFWTVWATCLIFGTRICDVIPHVHLGAFYPTCFYSRVTRHQISLVDFRQSDVVSHNFRVLRSENNLSLSLSRFPTSASRVFACTDTHLYGFFSAYRIVLGLIIAPKC